MADWSCLNLSWNMINTIVLPLNVTSIKSHISEASGVLHKTLRTILFFTLKLCIFNLFLFNFFAQFLQKRQIFPKIAKCKCSWSSLTLIFICECNVNRSCWIKHPCPKICRFFVLYEGSISFKKYFKILKDCLRTALYMLAIKNVISQESSLPVGNVDWYFSIIDLNLILRFFMLQNI